MKRGLTRRSLLGGLVIVCLAVAVAHTHAGTTAPKSPSAVQGKLERLRIAVAPLGWDTNYTWLQSRSG
ncbi:MAG TPA: hypothetical protein VLK82_03780, partial [Candidatus Tectomicrobia bacterium]|nr:hypothetical protein [Candidatus Tectomicrobia bacterium]